MDRTHHARLDRRRLLGTSAAGIGLAIAPAAIRAQATPEASPEASPAASPAAATPDPNATWETISISRADSLKAIRDHYQMEDPANTGGDVIQVFTTDIATLNPILAQDLAAGYILGLVYQGMVGLSPIDGTPVPALADSWEISSDGLRYRLHLNPDATWHDGQPVTAADALATFDAILAPDSLAANSATIRDLLAAYTAVDDHT
ncbi:MAG TPA: ABC transporter substrate-binding protein, partial [Thermomicrobiales bacterium]|nr:ABC transporter substrate-binding protein [Thermomicrobiales bacterium]